MRIRNEVEALGFAVVMVITAILLPVWFICRINAISAKPVPTAQFKVTKPELRPYFDILEKHK